MRIELSMLQPEHEEVHSILGLNTHVLSVDLPLVPVF